MRKHRLLMLLAEKKSEHRKQVMHQILQASSADHWTLSEIEEKWADKDNIFTVTTILLFNDIVNESINTAIKNIDTNGNEDMERYIWKVVLAEIETAHLSYRDSLMVSEEDYVGKRVGLAMLYAYEDYKRRGD